jgi:hypothetical protein
VSLVRDLERPLLEITSRPPPSNSRLRITLVASPLFVVPLYL